MTILHVLNTGSFSGAENVVVTLIEGFRKYDKENIKFIYVSLNGSIRDVLRDRCIEFEPIEKMTRSEIHRVIKKYKPDIVHAHDFTASIVCAFAAGKTPVISHLHNNSPWIKTYCKYSFVYGLSCAKYKKILAVSASVFDEYVFGKRIKPKSSVVGNPISTAKILETANNCKVDSEYDVAFLGRLTPQKKPVFFIEIINAIKKTHPNIRAIMIGDGELRAEIERAIEKYGLQSNVRLAGFMKNPYGVLKSSKLLCMPSAWEGFGLAAVEALALGVPVVASGAGGLKDIITDECGKICSSADEYAAEMCRLIDDEDYRMKKSRAAQKRGNDFDNIESYTKTMRSLYSEIRGTDKW